MRRRHPPPLTRILRNAATVVSLLLCLVTLMLWVRSYCLGDLWSRTGPHSLAVVLLHGRVIIDARSHTFVRIRDRSRNRSEFVDTSFVPSGWSHEPADEYPCPWSPAESTLGFVAHTNQSLDLDVPHGVDRIERRHIVGLPLWCPLIGFGVLPALRLARHRARGNPSRARLCPTCNYDTPTRCPECGSLATPPPPPQ
jgi:hypothetical protein